MDNIKLKFTTKGGTTIPWNQQGLKVLGCPTGTNIIRRQCLQKLEIKISDDYRALGHYGNLGDKNKFFFALMIAKYCTNTRVNYLLHRISLDRPG